MEYQKSLNQKIIIRNKVFPNRLNLSPMASLTHIALRKLISDFSPTPVFFTPMCNASGIVQKCKITSQIFKYSQDELDNLICQIIGSDSSLMRDAAVIMQDIGFAGIDINFSCPASKICKKGFGAALISEPEKCAKIVSEIRKAVFLPIFVKIRFGAKKDIKQIINFCKGLEDSGADAIVFHPRVLKDKRTRPPDYESIKILKENLSVFVYANGNVLSNEDARKILDITNADGISLGRISAAKPFIFAQILNNQIIDDEVYSYIPLKFLELLKKYYEEEKIILKLYKKFTPYFASNFAYANTIVKKILNIDNLNELEDTIKILFSVESVKDLVILKEPNRNFLI